MKFNFINKTGPSTSQLIIW